MKMKEYIWLQDGASLVRELNARWEKQSNYLNSAGLWSVMKRAYDAYYGQTVNQNYQTGYAGEQDEFSTINVNHARNVIKHIIAMVTQNRINFDALATNTDLSARNATIVARAVLDQQFYEKRYEKEYRSMLEMGLIFGISFLHVCWRPGKNFAGVDGDKNPVYSGESEIRSVPPMDVLFDPVKPYWKDQQWCVVRENANKNDLAALAGDEALAKKIMALKKITSSSQFSQYYEYDEETVWVYHGYHKATPALPKGRYVVFCEDDIVIQDGENPYGEMNVFCYKPDQRHASAYGHTPLFDIMPVQEALNILDSSFLTIIDNYSVPNLVASKRCGIDETQMTGGSRLILADPDPDAPNAGFPTPLQMPSIPPDMIKQRESYIRDIEALSGINSVVRGSPSQFIPSGTAIALISASAQTFNGAIEGSYIEIIEESSMCLLQVLHKFQAVEQLITVAGKANTFSVVKFKAADLKHIRQIRVQLGNPMAKTLAGKMQIADQLLVNGMLTSPAEYLDVMQTGKIETATDSKLAQKAYIQLENEQLMQGEQPLLSYLDHPIDHINAHMMLTFRPEIRANESILASVLSHIQEHLDQLETLNAQNPIALAIATGQPVPLNLQAPQAPGQAPPGGGQPQPPKPAALPAGAEETAGAEEQAGQDSAAAAGLRRAERTMDDAKSMQTK